MFPLAKFRPSTVSGEGRGALLSLLGGDAPPGFLRLLQETLHLGASKRVADLSGLQSNNGGLVWSKEGRPKLPEAA